jgi:hypothetical protein
MQATVTLLDWRENLRSVEMAIASSRPMLTEGKHAMVTLLRPSQYLAERSLKRIVRNPRSILRMGTATQVQSRIIRFM